MHTQPPPFPARTSQQGRKRTPIGNVALGCGIFAILLLFLLAGGVIWFLLPGGNRINMNRLIGTNTLAVIHIKDCSEDPGVIALVERMNQYLRDARQKSFEQQLPPGFEWARGFSTISKRGLKASHIPEGVAVIETGTNTNLVYMAALGLDVLPRFILIPFRLMINHPKGAGTSRSYRGEVIADFGDVFGMLIGSSAVVASDSNTSLCRIADWLNGVLSLSSRKLQVCFQRNRFAKRGSDWILFPLSRFVESST